MNIFNKVTLQSLKWNKTRTVVTIIGIILSAAMICAVTTFASSFMNYALETAIYKSGDWHGSEINTSYETYEDVVNHEKVEEAVYLIQLGYAVEENSKNEYKPYIYLLGAGEDVENMLPIHITSGKYPTSTKEIMLPEHLYTNGGVKYRLGDTITLDLGQRMLDGYSLTQKNIYVGGEEALTDEVLEVRESRTYTVTGFYERLDFNIEPYEAPGYTALTLADENPSSDYKYDVYFKMEKPKEVYEFMKSMGFTGEENADVLLYSGTSRYDTFTTVLYSLAAIVIGLIMFGSISLIYNAFSISVSERTKQFGLLSSVGATKKQLRRMVFFEALAVSIIGIPIGVLAGVGGIGVTLLFIGDKFRSMGFPIDMRLSVSPEAIVIAILVALVTVLISAFIPSKRATKVSAVEAIRQHMDVRPEKKAIKTSKIAYKFFGLPGVLASKYFKRSKKKYRATVISLFMSIVLFVSASAFSEYLMESVNDGFGSVGYDLYMHTSDAEFSSTSPDALLEEIKNAKSITDAVYTMERYIDAEIDRKYLTDEAEIALGDDGSAENDFNIPAYATFVNDAAFKSLLNKYGLDEKEYMSSENPLAIVVDGSTLFNASTERFETTSFLNGDECEIISRREKTIDGYFFYGEIEDENGNVVARYMNMGEQAGEGETYGERETYIDLPLEEAYVRTTLNTGKVIYEKPFYVGDSNGITLIYPASLANAVFQDLHEENSSYYFKMVSDDHAASETAIETILSDNGFNPNELTSIAELEETDRNIVSIIQVFSYGFIVLISLIAAANVFNTISTNISLRRREFAMLKSVGMTAKDFNRMMNYECLLYGSKALLLGLPVSCIITYFIYLSINEGFDTTFTLPWVAIGIAVLSVFVVVFATMIYSMSKIKKDNPIDALKNENL